MTGPLQAKGKYAIKMARKEAHEGLFSLANTNMATFNQATEMLAGHLSQAPKTMIPGRLKALTGQHRGLYQLSLAGANRLIYRVNDEELTVYVEYVGSHPNWERSRPGRGL